MRFLFGLFLGVCLTFSVAYFHDFILTASSDDPNAPKTGRIVNWDALNRDVVTLGNSLREGWNRLTKRNAS